MKRIEFSTLAQVVLFRHKAEATRIIAKIKRYAETGAGDVTVLKGRTGKRLRVGDYRVILEETDALILVLDIGPRHSIYD